MRKLIYSFLVIASVSLVSCVNQQTAEFSPAGPQSDESSMPHNRPTGPEGAGALGILSEQ